MDALKTRRWWALGALTRAVLAVGLAGTVLSVALPTLATDLHASTADLQWFVSGYTLVLAAALLPAGLLGDRYGRKKVLLGALALFGVGSLAVAFAPSAGAFIAARVLLGLGAAAVIPLSLSVLTVLFTPEERPRAVGVWAAANFLALPPAQVADAARDRVFAGVAVARRLGSAPLLDSVQAAFVHGMDGMLWVCAAIAVAGMVLALIFLPGRAAAAATPPPEPARVGG